MKKENESLAQENKLLASLPDKLKESESEVISSGEGNKELSALRRERRLAVLRVG
ncbi:MAG: hypothetical protein LBU33_03035 [Endomicrobium sp.]|nr:hypothetical protein [Endomicrobium sp.]